VRKYWPDLKIVSLNDQGGALEQLSRILGKYGAVQAPPNITVGEPGLTLTARVNWLVKQPEHGGNKGIHTVALTLLTDPAEQTPTVVLRYFADRGWALREIVSQGTDLQVLTHTDGGAGFSSGRVLATEDTRALIKELLQVMGFACTPNNQITFTYAGLELSAWADLVQDGDGRQFLLNLGQIQGEAVGILKDSGIEIVDLVTPHLLRDKIVTVFQALNVSCTHDPVLWAAARAATHNTSITVTGLLASPLIGRQFLITPFNYSPPALQIFHERGIQVVQLKMRDVQRKASGW
jgi:hypothetical protein